MKFWPALVLVAVAALASAAAAQLEVYIDNSNASLGSANTIPWGQAGGYTSLHVYTAAQLAAAGLCPGATLTDFAVAPSTSGGGSYNAPQARLQIGHLAVDPPVAGAWLTHLDSPVTAHDLTSGPYTFSWVPNIWTSLPGVSTAGFVWDGVRSIGILYTSSAGTTGTFSARRTTTNLRHGVNVFNATTQAPTTTGLFAMKTRMTWAGYSGGYTCTIAQPGGAGADLFIDNMGGTPGNSYLNIMTQNAGAFPAGWAFGVDIPLDDLVAEIVWGNPFFGTLDACGQKHQVVLAPIPSGITAYIVALELAGGIPVNVSTPFIYVTP